jgi:hypothetical protein
MPWEPSTQTMTLLIERNDLGNGRHQFKLHPFFRRSDRDGLVSLCPLSESTLENSQLVFSAIEFVERPQVPNGGQDGDTVLTTTDYYRQPVVGALP